MLMESKSTATAATVGQRPRAVVIGGSIAGLCSAHALIASGWEVTVLEKSTSPPVAHPTGAGLGLEPQAQKVISCFVSDPDATRRVSFHLSSEIHHVLDIETKKRRCVVRDDDLDYCALHWSDLHAVIYGNLPSSGVFVLWGHRFLSLHHHLHLDDDGGDDDDDDDSDGRSHESASPAVTVRALVLATGDTVELAADLVVGADGSRSTVRQLLLPCHVPRYRGYYAWRGVFNCGDDVDYEEVVNGVRRVFPELGHALYFETAVNAGHCVLVELPGKRINWIWFVNGPEPILQGNSMTALKVTKEAVDELHKEADRVWQPELAKMMKETKEPFVNAIYDAEPPEKLYFWPQSVVLVGDAAHPCTPHGSRSTNMAILDAEALGASLRKWGVSGHGAADWLVRMEKALEEYQSARLPVVSQQVVRSLLMGRMRQGLTTAVGDEDDDDVDRKPSSLNLETSAGEENCKELLLKYMPFMNCAPIP